MKEPKILVNHDLLQLIAEIDEFKGKWEALKNLSPERLRQLRKAATIESVGSSTRTKSGNVWAPDCSIYLYIARDICRRAVPIVFAA
jgi:hypothetical protein